ncbi:UPF0481 protein At3g47200-like [Spinacia oleracea]|uniref:UPF0481 protein At3g47200-like n=1 Tax=Spinacia oleracea TaxID=3562 RepID=A0A9R0JHB2_SPIOL|nr:UPF0481 protein At3g47200-like [Spinacia oleracea]
MSSKTPKKRKRVPIGKMEDGIHQLAKSIRKRFDELPPLSSKCCIYRVPRTLRNVNLSAYKPWLISIGPLHYGTKSLQGLQEQKLRYLQNFLRRNEEKTLKDYLKAIKEWEIDARECYIENITLSSDEFVEMMLLDSCFIIEFFLNWYWETLDEDDRIFGKPSLEHVIRRDLLLVENQLPFFVLENLYDLVFEDDDESSESSIPFSDLTSEVLIGKRELPKRFKRREILHFVDFLRTYFLPRVVRDPNYVPSRVDACWEFPPGVGDLHDAGVKFVVNRSDSLLDIEFKDGVLYIPKLEVEDHTESILLNLSVFEQCHYHSDSYIVDYILLMDVLITTLKDVDILLSSGIITNALGNNEEVAHLFNTICRETNYEAHKFYYTDICRRLVAHSKAPWNRWKATLKHDYFNNPWTIISVIAAIVLLILTVVQTACTVIAFKRH